MTLKTETIKKETVHYNYIKNCKALYGRKERRKRGRDGGKKKGDR